MTLAMVKNVLGAMKSELMFYEGNDIEVINENTGGHYHKDHQGRMTLGGDLLDASEKWVLGLPVTGVETKHNTLIIYIDG